MTTVSSAHVAVIGLSLRFPGADSPERFWDNVRTGTVSLRHFRPGELEAAGTPAAVRADPEFVAAGAPLGDVSGFDAEYFGMSPREATITDPQHRMFLECCQHALEDAGYPLERDGLSVGVFASTGHHLYSMQNYLLNNVLPEGIPDDWVSRMQTMVGNYPDFTATRASFRLGLTGPSVNVQTGCSSSLVAVQLAARCVVLGDADLAVAGATAVHVPQTLGYRFVKGSILSRSGVLRAFDAASDGTVGGSGVAAVVLKRLDRALADGDTVYGVIRGCGVTNDGAAKRGYAAPSSLGQYRAIRRAFEAAGVDAATIGYLETHGTGTFKGDPIEFEGAVRAFREDSDLVGHCALGATKANIGHLDVCSGLAGLIKALLVLRHGVIPPLAGFTAPNPALALAGSPFYIPTEARDWPRGDVPRRAGVTSLGVGGTNVHIVLEEPPAPAPRACDAPPPPPVLPLSGRSRAALAANARAFRDRLRRTPEVDMADLVTTAALGRRSHPHRLAVRGATPGALADALDRHLTGGAASAATGVASEGAFPGVALLFTGQGEVHPGTAGPLYERFPVVRDVLDRCEELYRAEHGASLLRSMRAPGAVEGTWPSSSAQPALFALQCALTALWASFGIEPAVTAGHSLGEYAALYAAGGLTLTDGLRLTAWRGHLTERLGAPGGMVAVHTDRAAAAEYAAREPGVELAAVNGELRQVLAGPAAAVDRLCRTLDDAGVAHRRLTVDRAFHTALMDPVLEEFRHRLDGLAFRPLRVPFVSAVDGAARPAGWLPDAAYLLNQARRPVRFDLVLREPALRGVGALIEAGPRGTLCALAREALPDVPALPSLPPRGRLEALWEAVAALYCAGAPLDWRTLLDGCDGRRISLPGYPFQHRKYWTGPAPAPDGAEESTKDGVTPMESWSVTQRVRRRIIEVTARHLNYSDAEIAPDTSFFDLGADSLQMINVLRELEQEHRVKVTMRELFEEATTPRQLAELIVGRSEGPAPESTAGTTPEPVPATTPEPVPGTASVSPLRPVPSMSPSPSPSPSLSLSPDAVPPRPASAGHEECASRRELVDLTRQVMQISQIQLQLMNQLTQMLATTTPTAAPVHGNVVR
ncbi:type I polyketide synthase [Streptomyces sp. LUP30]|uniref:type I polyketide synthase n=1 Tax=Streptomyces sp. LUP30 TaxID=1890285 RepID=UPI000851DDC2|nr:type I polyketide synthase [Streptomyces sp. LUP30]